MSDPASGLPPDYLDYPNRKYGQDVDRYDWSLAHKRSVLRWPNGKSLAITVVVPLEWFPLDPSSQPFKHPGAMQTPYPDLRHYTTRDYGNRVGSFRLLRCFADAGVSVTFAVNAVLLDRARPLIDTLVEKGHEVAAHGWDTNTIHWQGLNPAEEEALVAKTRAAFEAAGLSPTAWMSPARQQSAQTPDLLTAYGFSVCLDWEMDHCPLAIRTKQGPLHCVPVLNELDDRKLLITAHQSEASWRDQIVAAADLMVSEAPRLGGQSLGFAMTPYITGQPFRIKPVREMLAALTERPQVFFDGVTAVANAAVAGLEAN